MREGFGGNFQRIAPVTTWHTLRTNPTTSHEDIPFAGHKRPGKFGLPVKKLVPAGILGSLDVGRQSPGLWHLEIDA
jgi:hypothetical protein